MQFIEDISLKYYHFTDEAYNFSRRYFDDVEMDKIESALQNDFCEILTSNTINQIFCHDREYLCYCADSLIYPVVQQGFNVAKEKTVKFLRSAVNYPKTNTALENIKKGFCQLFLDEYTLEQKGYLLNLFDRLFERIFFRLSYDLSIYHFCKNADRVVYMIDYFENLSLSDFDIFE